MKKVVLHPCQRTSKACGIYVYVGLYVGMIFSYILAIADNYNILAIFYLQNHALSVAWSGQSSWLEYEICDERTSYQL